MALTNTTMAVFMSSLDGSILLIALPAIFDGIHLDPLAPGNIAYLLWLIMGYRLVQAVFVVNLGRLGDVLGRVRIYNLGFRPWVPRRPGHRRDGRHRPRHPPVLRQRVFPKLGETTTSTEIIEFLSRG